MSSVERVVALAVAALAVANVHAQAPSAASALPAAIRGASSSAPPAPAAAAASPQGPAAAAAKAPASPPAPAAPPQKTQQADALAHASAREPKGGAHSGLPSDASIGTITELSRQLKVQQLRKELREAGKEQTGTLQGGGDAVPVGGAPKKAAAAPAIPLVAPTVVGIVGNGGQRRVRLLNGGELTEGQSIASPVNEAMLVSIGTLYATFRVCERAGALAQPKAGRPGAAASPRCEMKNVPPSGA